MSKPFKFLTDCVGMQDGDLVNDLKSRGVQVSYSTFARKADLAELRRGGHPAMWRASAPDNWSISFWQTTMPSGAPVLYFAWSGIEHFFVDRPTDLDAEVAIMEAREEAIWGPRDENPAEDDDPVMALTEWLEDEQVLTIDEVERLVSAVPSYRLEPVRLHGGVLWRLTDPSGQRFVIETREDGTADVSTVDDFLDRMQGDPAGVEWLMGPDPETADFWHHPGPLYHGTSREAWAAIQRSGALAPRSDSRALSNRFVGESVFTVSDREWIASDYDVILRIDTQAMARDGLTHPIEREPAIVEGELLAALAHMLGEEEFVVDGEPGVWPDTFILHGSVPLRYLTVKYG
jgi:hypothetical protein